MVFDINKEIESLEKLGPVECWCSPGGGASYPCKKNKLCKETNEKYKKIKQKYLKSKTYKKDKEKRQNRSLDRAKRRREHKKTKAYKRFIARLNIPKNETKKR